jgi:hypothetical protein|tara:strand:+ start:146 stop:424 length:279 start_codon:yes stop_codon:yes gene_type:complete
MIPEFIDSLSSDTIRVIFRKRSNGLARSLLCTLNPDMIPPEQMKTFSSVLDTIETYGNRYVVWDIESLDWRSFYEDTIISFERESENTPPPT